MNHKWCGHLLSPLVGWDSVPTRSLKKSALVIGQTKSLMRRPIKTDSQPRSCTITQHPTTQTIPAKQLIQRLLLGFAAAINEQLKPGRRRHMALLVDWGLRHVAGFSGRMLLRVIHGASHYRSTLTPPAVLDRVSAAGCVARRSNRTPGTARDKPSPRNWGSSLRLAGSNPGG